MCGFVLRWNPESSSVGPEVVLPILVATDFIHVAEKEKQNPVPDWH